jgi:hypothetical protein
LGSRFGKVACATVVSLALLGQSNAFAHDGYHYATERGTAARKGMWWTVEVTNPSTPALQAGDTTVEHFVAPGWMDDPNTSTTCAPGQSLNKWIELGWGERGDLLLANGNPYRFVYEFDSGSCSWFLAAGVTIETGDIIELLMLPTGATCGPGQVACEWTFYVKKSGGSWIPFRTTTMLIGNDVIPQTGSEVQSKQPGGEQHWQIAGADADWDIDWFDVYLRHADGLWYRWTSSELSAIEIETSPYVIHYGTNWWRFGTKRPN